MDNGYQFSKDTIASILTSGLLGEVYIGLESGGDPQMLADGGTHHQDAIGRRAREAHRPVPVRQGHQRSPPNEKNRPSSPRSRARLLLSGCASTPGRIYDPFEASQSRDVRDQRAARWSTSRSRSRRRRRPSCRASCSKAVSNYFNNIDDLFSIVNDALQGKWEKMGNDMARVMINTGFGFAGPDRHRERGRHPARRRGFRPDFRALGHPAGAVPVHPAMGADHGARRHGLDPALLVVADQRDSRTCRCAT